MFNNKNTRITYEILPTGKLLIETHLSKDVSVDGFVELLSDIFNCNLLHTTLQSVIAAGKKSNSHLGEDIVSLYMERQEMITHSQNRRSRHPLIQPDQVFANLQRESGNN